MPGSPEDRLFVKNGLRHYRRTYSLTEFRVGLVILFGLALIATWVAWRGPQADPELFSAAPGQVQRAVVVGESSGGRGLDAAGRSTGADEPKARGGVPENLAPPGWRERELTTFGPENVYEKINGREGYYKSFGFESLVFVALESETDPNLSVDLELYDQGKIENALGAFAGELPEGAAPEASELGLVHRARNALFLARGRYYARVVGSDEGPAIQAALDHLRSRLEDGLPAEPLPWAYALFAGKLRIPPGRVSYTAESAFSFTGFDDVWVALLADEETELFVSRRKDEAEAQRVMESAVQGFRAYGDPEPARAGLSWIKDRYLARYSVVVSKEAHVLGVRGAESVEAGEAELRRLEAGLH